MSTTLLLTIALIGVLLLLFLVIKIKMQPFVALLLVSVLVGLTAGIPPGKIIGVMTDGMGSVLGTITMIIGLGAMLGKIIEVSGGAESLASKSTSLLGKKRVIAGLTIAAFLLSIPVFFDVGFIIIAPIIYGFARVNGISPLKVGLPVAGVMLATHVVVPPHPGPVAAAGILGADVGLLTMLGLAICIPLGVVSYWTAKLINKRNFPIAPEIETLLNPPKENTENFPTTNKDAVKIPPPNAWLIAGIIIFPITLIMLGTVSATLLEEGQIRDILGLIGSPPVALLLALGLAFYFIALRRNWSLEKSSEVMGDALPAAAVVIMVTGAGGVFGRVLVESGVGNALADTLTGIGLPLIPAAFLISLALRASQGSATVAILTSSALLSTAVAGLTQSEIVLITLSACFGGLGLSHINDSGFWIVTKYLGLSVADGLKTWTILTTVLGLVGFLITWGVSIII